MNFPNLFSMKKKELRPKLNGNEIIISLPEEKKFERKHMLDFFVDNTNYPLSEAESMLDAWITQNL